MMVVGSETTKRIIVIMPPHLHRPLRRLLRAAPPLALGTTFGER